MSAAMQPAARQPRLGGPLEVFSSLLRHRSLLHQLVRRDVVGRYRGSVLGIFWSFFHPLLMLAVFTFVFSVVFQARWGGTGGGRADFALAVFVGMIVHGLFAEVVTRAPALITGNANYVKRVVFPLEVLPWVTMGSALFHALASTLVWLVFYLAVHGSLHWTAVLLPVVVAPLVLVTMGLAWFFASTAVYFRDIGQAVGVLASVMLFLAPVFYPASALPEPYRSLLYLNPLTFIIEQARAVLIDGTLPDWGGLAVFTVAGLAVAWLGLAWFNKTRRGFADVL